MNEKSKDNTHKIKQNETKKSFLKRVKWFRFFFF